MALTQPKKLEIITKHGRKFSAKNGSSTSVLEGAHYAADGSVIVCDRHKLLRIQDAHNFTEPFTSHCVTGAPIDGTYPGTSKLIPMELKTQITLIDGYNRADIKDAIARVKLAVDVAKLYGDKTNVATLTYAGSSVILSVKDEIPTVSFWAGINADITGPDETVSFNAEYMLAALNVFKDAGSSRVIIGLTGAMTPIVLRDEDNGIDVIILPYRRAT
jgi:DNA polymerase III sliding clamp (beta) subunit (PCNA family)